MNSFTACIYIFTFSMVIVQFILNFLETKILKLSTKLLSQCRAYVYNAADEYITPAI